MSTADLAAALLAVFEGERLTAYRDTGGVWTIGFGHTKDVTAGMTITHDQAVEFLTQDAAALLHMIEDRSALEGAALVSFGYNTGVRTLQRVLDGEDSIGNPIHTTDRTGNVRPGLVARRQLEAALIEVAQQ